MPQYDFIFKLICSCNCKICLLKYSLVTELYKMAPIEKKFPERISTVHLQKTIQKGGTPYSGNLSMAISVIPNKGMDTISGRAATATLSW